MDVLLVSKSMKSRENSLEHSKCSRPLKTEMNLMQKNFAIRLRTWK